MKKWDTTIVNPVYITFANVKHIRVLSLKDFTPVSFLNLQDL